MLTDATGWNDPKNCELWRSEWAKVCNAHLSVEQRVDHRSYARQGKLEIPTIHEGADARKIDEKFQNGQVQTASWKVEENQIIKRQNTLLKKIQISFGKVSGALSQWKERLNDLRRKPGSYSHDGVNDKPDRGTAEAYGRDGTGIAETGQAASVLSGAEPEFADIKQRVIRAAESFARYRRTAFPDRAAEKQNRTVGKRESAMAEINAEAEQREQLITETEQRIADLKQQIENARDIDERREIKYKFNLMLENRTIEVWAYNLETVLAEKLETVISRNVTNTRMRDFYDIYILQKLYGEQLSKDVLRDALVATAKKRETLEQIETEDIDEVFDEIQSSSVMENLWKAYQRNYSYSADIPWHTIMKSIRTLYEIISKNTYNVLQFAKNVEKPNDGTTKQGKELHHE